jgi:hypothetical protein
MLYRCRFTILALTMLGACVALAQNVPLSPADAGSPQSWTPILTIALTVCMLGLLAIVIYTLTGIGLRRFQHNWAWFADKVLNVGQNPTEARIALQDMMPVIKDCYPVYQHGYNEFWTTYGQVIIVIIIITLLTVLLLTKTISPDAGLPILSAVAGYGIAKNVGPTSHGTPPRTASEVEQVKR